MTTTADTAVDRLQAALADPDAVFNRDQLVYLMDASARWARESADGEPSELTFRAGIDVGYRARCREENAAYPPAPIYDAAAAGRWTDQVWYRRRCDRDARRRRRGDYRGGPVALWPSAWCGDDAQHGPHVAGDAGDRFRCEGRR